MFTVVCLLFHSRPAVQKTQEPSPQPQSPPSSSSSPQYQHGSPRSSDEAGRAPAASAGPSVDPHVAAPVSAGVSSAKSRSSDEQQRHRLTSHAAAAAAAGGGGERDEGA